MSPLPGHADTVSLWEAGSVEACGWAFSPILSLAPLPDPRSQKANGRSGVHPYQLFGAKKEEVIERLPRRLASRGPPCPVNRLVEWLPSLSFEACVSSWGPPGMADGCGDMDPRCRSERIHGM